MVFGVRIVNLILIWLFGQLYQICFRFLVLPKTNHYYNIMKKKILLVDDIKEFRTLLKILLSGNYEVVTAENGEAALNLILGGYEPDVIVTDLLMPRMDGYQLISRVKSNDSYRNIPIIVLSNVDNAGKKRKLSDTGIAGFMNKPYNAFELKEGLSDSLNTVLASYN